MAIFDNQSSTQRNNEREKRFVCYTLFGGVRKGWWCKMCANQINADLGRLSQRDQKFDTLTLMPAELDKKERF